MTNISYIADFRIGSAWFNRSLSSFAIVPGASDADLDRTTASISSLVESYRNAPNTPSGQHVKNHVITELHELHTRGQILWPIGSLYDQSVLGKLSSRRPKILVTETDISLISVRDELSQSPAFRELLSEGGSADRLSFEFWKIYLTLTNATTPLALTAIRDINEAHLFALIDAMLDNGAWADWVPSWIPNRMQKMRAFLAIERSDPRFAMSFMNFRRRGTIKARILGTTARSPHLDWITAAFNTWMDGGVTLTKKGARQALSLLLEFMESVPQENTSPENAFIRKNVKALLAFAKNWNSATARGLAISKIYEFAEWYYFDFASDRELEHTLSMKRYDVEQFLKAIPSVSKHTAEVAAKPMPARFHHKLKEIISENDFAWPKALLEGGTGLPVHWIPWENPETGRIDNIFCEVLPRMLLLMLDLPLRNIQVRRLDSGEGDDREYDPSTGKWIDAVGPHAGYWRKKGAKNMRRGAVREILTQTGTIAGLWINSNKTMDARNLFDETSGYEIPWQHEDVIQNITAMRKWQNKYNPVGSPLPHAQLPGYIFNEEPTRIIRALLPDRFYLFRYPANTWSRGHECPVSYHIFIQFFMDALDELERRLRDEDADSEITIITDRDSAGQPRKAIFTMHGMRSSNLTSLYMAGVPIGILSKFIAGHATILMTLRYTKFDPAHVSEVLEDARSKVLTNARGQFGNFLKNATIEHAMRMTARLSDDGIHQAKITHKEPSAWARMDIGICPNGGTLCHIGGERINSRTEKTGRSKSSHKPVPGGARNCVRCRFFITGLPFLIALYAHGTAVLAKNDAFSRRISQLENEIRSVKVERHALGAAVPETLRQRIRVLEEMYFSEIDLRDLALADAHATMVYIEKVRAIAAIGDAENSAKIPMLLGNDAVPALSFRESTRFEISDALMQASLWFPSVYSKEIESERYEFLNQVLWRNGYVPITLSPLTDDERRKAADATAKFLLTECGATETEHLIAGRKSLADLGLQVRLEEAAKAAIGRPFERLKLSHPKVATFEPD